MDTNAGFSPGIPPLLVRRAVQAGERDIAARLGAYRPGGHGGYAAADEIGAGYSTQRLRGTFYRLVESAGLRRITFYYAVDDGSGRGAVGDCAFLRSCRRHSG